MNQLNEISASETQLRIELPGQQFEFDELKFKLSEIRRQLSVANRLNARILENASEGMLITDARKIIRQVNPAFEKSTGYSAAEAIGRTPAMLKSDHHDDNFYREMWDALSREGQWRGEIWNRNKNGDVYPEWLSICAVRDNQQSISHYVGIFSDAKTHHDIMERLHYLAYSDGLTGLPNRRLFIDRLNMSISHARRDRHLLAVMFIDLDHFKQINDTRGHKTGDELLIGISERMKSCLREEDTLARLAGDEFTVLLPSIPHTDAAHHVAQKFLECCTRPLVVGGHELSISASIGIAIYPNDGEDADTLLQHADTAMYHIKESGRNGYMRYAPEMGEMRAGETGA